jgi:hypothetical protein
MQPKTLEEALEVINGLNAKITEKDQIIEQKNQDIVGIRKDSKRLKELTDEERQALTQKEIEIHEATLQLQRDQEAHLEEQRNFQNTQRLATRDKILRNFVGNNEELFEKMKSNFDLIKGSDEAFVEDQIKGLAETAFNMLGNDKPENVVQHVANGDGGRAPTESEKKDYSETPEGQSLANALNLSQAQPEPPATS